MLVGVAVLEIADLLVDVVFLPRAPQVRPGDEAGGAGHLETGLEDVAAVLLGLRDRRPLVDEEDRHVAGAGGHQRQLVLGHGPDDHAEDDTPGSLQRDLLLGVRVEANGGRVLVRSPGPGEPEGRVHVGGRRSRGRVRRRRVGPRPRRARRVGPVGHPGLEDLGVRPDEHAHPDARREHRPAAGDRRLRLALFRALDRGLDALVGLGILLLLDGLSGRGEKAREVPVRGRRRQRLGEVRRVPRVVGVGADQNRRGGRRGAGSGRRRAAWMEHQG